MKRIRTASMRGEYHMPPWASELNARAEIEGASYEEIAKELGVSRARVQQLIATGLRKVRRGVRRRGLRLEDVL